MAAHESEGVTVRMGSFAVSGLPRASVRRVQVADSPPEGTALPATSTRFKDEGWATTRKRWSERLAGKRQPPPHIRTEFPQLSRHSLWKCVRRHLLRAAPASLRP